jgi:hypothetical protein
MIKNDHSSGPCHFSLFTEPEESLTSREINSEDGDIEQREHALYWAVPMNRLHTDHKMQVLLPSSVPWFSLSFPQITSKLQEPFAQQSGFLQWTTPHGLLSSPFHMQTSNHMHFLSSVEQ